TTVTAQMMVKVYNVLVNGTALDVGPNCQTATPINITLTNLPDYTGVQRGGHLAGTVTIPPFTGCGVTENLDSLFTGPISGPGNYLRMNQGALCTQAQLDKKTCTQTIPTP